MKSAAWFHLTGDAFEDFQIHHKAGLDRYGATNPAEFFAILSLSEMFFETPVSWVDAYPDLCELLTLRILAKLITDSGPS